MSAITLLAVTACSSAAPPANDSVGDGDTGAVATASPDSGGGAGGGTTTDWCLNTVEEVSAALDVEATQAVGNDAPGVGGGCLYNAADGSLLYAISVVTSGPAADTFQAAKGGPNAVVIDGIGDDAVLIDPQGPLAVLKGNAFISLGALPPVPIMGDAAAYQGALEELGKAAVDRMP